MKPFKRHIAARLLAAALVLMLPACGSEPPKVQTVELPTASPTYLSFFSSQSMTGTDIAKYWSERFTEEHSCTAYIDFDSVAYYAAEGLSYRELLEKRLKSGAPDDLYVINAEDVMAFGEKGYWMDLSQMDFVQNLNDAALQQCRFQGKVFSVPLSLTGFGFLWNVDMLTAHGLAVPQNREEFLQVCETLKNAGILPYGANRGSALTVPAMCVGFSSLYGSEDFSQRSQALNSGQTPVSSYMREGLAFIELLIERGYMDPKQAMEATPNGLDAELFLKGGCAFICTSMEGSTIEGEPPFKMRMTGVPVLPQGSVAVYGAGMRLCVNPDARQLDAALKFAEMVGTVEALDHTAQMSGTVSASKNSIVPESDYAELAALLLQPGQIPNQDFALHFNTWESIRDVCRTICQGGSVQDACDLLDQKQADDLAHYSVQMP